MPEQKHSKNIHSLVRLLTILAFISGIAIVGLAVFGIHGIYSRHVIGVAEKEAVLISRLLVDQQHELLFNNAKPKEKELNIDPRYQQWLDQRLREFLQPFDILKIKIFAPDTRILFSTDQSIIGEINPNNQRLQRALAGEVDSHLEQKEKIRDLKQETTFDVDVVETYTPILHDGVVVGVFELYMDVTQFREDIRNGTLKSLILLSSILLLVYLIAFSVARIGTKQVAEAEERLRKQAMTDALTGVFNRGELMNRAEEEIARVLRHGPDGGNGELSLVMIDIDHFKRVNDLHGHLAGDAVLRQLPKRIKQGLRLYDILGRYGGEEFLLLLPNAKLEDAVTVAERVRQLVEKEAFLYDNRTPIPVTISLGVTNFRQDSDLTRAIDKADQALFEAKQAGRNQVVAKEAST